MTRKNACNIQFQNPYHPDKRNIYGNFCHEFLAKHSLPSVTLSQEI